MITGIGGKQLAYSRVASTISLNDGVWVANHDLKPAKIPGQTRMLLLGEDFLRKFGQTVFDWTQDKVKLGEDWIYFNQGDNNDPLEACQFGPMLSISQKNNIQNTLCDHIGVFAHNSKAPKVCSNAIHLIKTEQGCISYERPRRMHGFP